MSLHLAVMADLTIAGAAAITRTVNVQEESDDAEAYYIESPTMITAVSSIIETSADGVTFRPFRNELNAAIIGPVSNSAIRLGPIPAPYWRVRLNAAEVAGLTLKLFKLYNAY